MYSKLLHLKTKVLHSIPTYRSLRGFHRTRLCRQEVQEVEEKLAINNVKVGQVTHGFMCTDIQHIQEYNMTAIMLRHETTHTEYLHLERDDPNNVFSIGFRTTPLNSMGTPHILEHTVLCGSEKYPVRDPFFKMLNRSLATFMNAMTGPDYTFYPFSSQNEVDYKNLQKVYLDAVFRPNLKRLDFLQEGWRLEHSNLEDKYSDIVFKGVVYNEMKGAFSETNSLFGQKFINAILPKGTYGYVSGGDPLYIPQLTHEDLRDFHATYYHPSNARVYSYGNFPLETNLKFLNETYLSDYGALDCSHSVVRPQERWTEPLKSNISCRVDQFGSPVEKQNQIAIGYVMSDITSVHETFLLLALSQLMIIGPNSAFYKSLIESNISGGYNGLTGYDNQIRDTLFVVGLKDLEQSKFDSVGKIVDETIARICEKGFEKDHIASVLHGFELSIKHQSPKFGLNLLFNLMPLWNHNGPIIEALKVNNLLDRLKKNVAQPNYLKVAVERYFVQNKHKLTMTMVPDPEFDDRFNEAEEKLLDSKVEGLSEKQKMDVYIDGVELSKAQKQVESLEVLPCLKIEEIILNKTEPPLRHSQSSIVPLQLCEANTNGVTYFKGVLSTASLNNEQRIMLPFFNYIADKFDTKSFNYRDFDKHVSTTTSGLGVSSHIVEHIGQPDKYEQGIMLSSHCLDENLPKMLDIWKEIFDKPNFNNAERLRMLLGNYCSSLTNGVIDSGHVYAMQSAKSLVSTVDACRESLSGLEHISTMQDILQKYSIEKIQELSEQIAKKTLTGHNFRAAFHYSGDTTSVEKQIEKLCAHVTRDDDGYKDVNRIIWTKAEDIPRTNKGLHISMNIPVNFCAKAIPTVTYTDPDFAKLRVLSRFLTSKYLHPIVREQNGAYGGGAVMSTEGIFSFYSYRDPNSRVTLNVFDECAAWLGKNTKLIDEQNLFESKLSILQQMDQPIAEYLKGVDLFLHGLSYSMWKTQRQRILTVKKEDLIEVSEKYLTPGKWNGKCVVGSGGEQPLNNADEMWRRISGPRQD